MERQPVQAQPQISPELQRRYGLVKNEYKQILKTILALDDEKKEHM
jgi:hypothetical protein